MRTTLLFLTSSSWHMGRRNPGGRAKRMSVALLLASVLLGLTPTLTAAERSWTGLASAFWSNPNNWSPVGTPQNGEDLVFAGPLNESMVNDLTGLSVQSLRLRERDFVLSGNTLTVLESIDV